MKLQRQHQRREEERRKMLSEILAYLHNYFEIDKLFGNFVIEDGFIKYADGREIPVKDGAYIRIVGSTFNDDVYCMYKDTPIDFIQNEAFNGAVWRLAVPKDVLATADDVKAWCDKYEAVDSASMSPYTSESFGGYSYSKNSSGGSETSWQSTFKSRLSRYRKI